MAEEKQIGRVVHYYTDIKVAAIELSDTLDVGDTIHIKGHTSDLTQKVESMQIDKEETQTAKKGDAIGIKVDDHVRENDAVYLVQ